MIVRINQLSTDGKCNIHLVKFVFTINHHWWRFICVYLFTSPCAYHINDAHSFPYTHSQRHLSDTLNKWFTNQSYVVFIFLSKNNTPITCFPEFISPMSRLLSCSQFVKTYWFKSMWSHALNFPKSNISQCQCYVFAINTNNTEIRSN